MTQRIHPEILQLLSAEADVVMNQESEPWPAELLLAHAREADALMVFMPDFVDAAFLDQCPRLKIVAAALKGYDNFDVAACRERGVAFTIVPDLLSEPTAELALALLLGLARNVRRGDELVRTGRFLGWRPILYGRSLVGATVGLIGYGAVGRSFENLISGFRCRVLWHDLREGGWSLDDVLKESDFLLPLLPLTPQTKHLVNERLLLQMKPGAFLINVGRGSVVDEEAVADCLEAGRLAGYAADVFEMEDWRRPDRPPSISKRLLQLGDRTLLTPHLGSATRSARLQIERAAALSIVSVLRGGVAEHAVELKGIPNER